MMRSWLYGVVRHAACPTRGRVNVVSGPCGEKSGLLIQEQRRTACVGGTGQGSGLGRGQCRASFLKARRKRSGTSSSDASMCARVSRRYHTGVRALERCEAATPASVRAVMAPPGQHVSEQPSDVAAQHAQVAPRLDSMSRYHACQQSLDAVYWQYCRQCY